MAILALLAASSAAADVPNPSGPGMTAGHFVFYPTLTVEFARDSNVLYATDESLDDKISSGVRVIRPGVLVEVPLGANRIRWSYSPSYKNYTAEVQQPEHFSHYFDFEGIFKFGSSLNLSLRDHFVRGTTELREVDPGGETAFGLVPFVLHQPEMTVDVGLGSRTSISVIPRYSKTRFDELDQAAFFNSRTRGLQGRYNYKVGPLDTLYGYYSYDNTDQIRAGTPATDIRQISEEAGLGFRRVMNEAVTSAISAGYLTLNFEGGAEQNSSGLVLDAAATWRPGDTLRIDVDARRNAYPSYWDINNFYVNNEVGIRAVDQIGEKFYWTVASKYLINRYPLVSPTFGVRRKDEVLRLEVGGGRQFLRSARSFVGYNYERRDSNIDAVTYTVERLVFRIEMGWL